MDGARLRRIVVVALAVLALVAVVGGVLGTVTSANTTPTSGAVAAPLESTSSIPPTDAAPQDTGWALDEGALPVGHGWPALIGRTSALIVLLGAFVLLRRQEVAGSAGGASRRRSPAAGRRAGPTLLGMTPGVLRV